MIGIYKITNKLNGKSYIGQSIHCGKRFDEHCKGKQLIDEIIQIDGIENFTFTIIKEVNKNDLSYWEDYYIIKYNTFIPNGYNKRWNCSKEIRNTIEKQIENEMSEYIINDKNYINVPTNVFLSKQISYNDAIYIWLLAHSCYNDIEKYNYINGDNSTYIDIGKEIGKSRQTVSKRFKSLLNNSNTIELLYYDKNKNIYIFPNFKETTKIKKETISILLRLCYENPELEELIKIYLWIKMQYEQSNKSIGLNDLIAAFGHSKGNKQIYNRYKDILTTLQGAGLIKFKTTLSRSQNGQYFKSLIISEVNRKASQEWLDKIDK